MRLVGRLGRWKGTQGNGEGFWTKWGKTADIWGAEGPLPCAEAYHHIVPAWVFRQL